MDVVRLITLYTLTVSGLPNTRSAYQQHRIKTRKT